MATKEFDVSEQQERFKFDIEAFVLGHSIRGVVATHDKVVLELSTGRTVAFHVQGPDIVITVDVPDSHEIVPPGVKM